jgi:phage regulator Rha-like protein
MSNLLTGLKFNKRFPSTVFVKLTNKTEIHNGFQFKTGLNVDTVEFDPTGECKEGGIYFCQYNKISIWIQYNETLCINYRIVTIPDDALVYIERDKYKANKMILSEKKDIRSDERICKTLYTRGINPIYGVIDQTEGICKMAVTENAMALKYIGKQTEEICKIAVAQYGLTICYVKEQTEEICKIAVAQHGEALRYVKNQTDEICKIAVARNGYTLVYVKDQTDEICKLAVTQDAYALVYVKNQTDEISRLALATI